MSILVVLAALAGRLMLGPLRIDFVRPMMESALSQQLDGFTVEFEHTVLMWGGWQRALDVRVTDLVLKDEAGATVAELPQAAIGFHAAGLFTGHLVPRTIALFSPDIQLLRRADGSFGLRKEDEAEGSAEVIRRLLSSMLSPPSTDNPLTRLVIEEAHLDIIDLAYEEDWVIPGATLEIRRTDAGLVATLNGELRGANRQASFRLRADYARSVDGVFLALDLKGAEPSMFARPIGELRVLRGWNLPVSGRVTMMATPEGDLGRTSFDLQAGAGQVAIPALAGPLQVDGARLAGRLDRETGRIYLSEMTLSVAGGSFSGKGALYATDQGEGADIKASMENLPFRTLAALWPVELKTQTRAWFERNVRAGLISDGTLALNVVPPKEQQKGTTDFDLQFRYQGLEVHYLRPLPPISDGSGRARLTPHEFDLWIDEGRIADPARSLDLSLTALSGVIEGLDEPGPQIADIVVAFEAEVPQLLTLLDYDPLGYARAFGVSPQDISGRLRGKARFRIPLITKVQLRDVEYGGWVLASDFLLQKGFETLEPGPGSLALTLDPSGIVAQGDLEFRQQPVQVSWTEAFGAKDGRPTRYVVSGTVTAERLRAFGLPEAVDMEGSVDAKLELVGKGTRIDEGSVRVDLQNATLGFPLLDWSKPAGVAGTLETDIATRPGGLLPQAFRVSTQALDAEGELAFGDDGSFASAEVPRFRVGDTAGAFAVRRPGEGPFDIRIEATTLDLRPFLTRDEEAEAEEADPDKDDGEGGLAAVVTLSADQAIAPEGVPVDSMDAVLRIERGELVDGQIAGILRSGKSMAVDYRLTGPSPGLKVWSDDGGELLRTLGVLDGVTGGTLAIDARIEGPKGGRHTIGTLRARDFRIKDSPIMAQMLTLGSLSGLRDLLTGEGIGFDRFDVDFDLGDDTLKLTDGRALGSQLGVRMSGRLYDRQTKLDIEGTLAPAYAINTVLDYVPVVGSILSGGENEGLIAIRFSVDGTTDEPDVSVNPLSALTPGFLRNIFDVFSSSPDGKRPKVNDRAPADE